MFGASLSPKHIGLYYSLIEDIGIKDLKQGALSTYPDTTGLETWLEKHHISYMVADDVRYHYKFLKVPSKPYVVYYTGDIGVLDIPLIGIVGPRKPSPYAEGIMHDFFAILQKYHVATISGGAPGIDTMCHRLSLQYNIPTVVVLGAGLGHYMHTKHSLVHEVVVGGGLVVSEFKLKQVPTHYTFPQRNRIIAGIAETLFVPAAGKKSGSLITVDFARQIHTTAYTVPASLHEPMSAGSNAYLAEKKMDAVVDYESMLDRYFQLRDSSERITSHASHELSQQQQAILSYIVEHVDCTGADIAGFLDMPISVVLSDITILEMMLCIREERPGHYRAV